MTRIRFPFIASTSPAGVALAGVLLVALTGCQSTQEESGPAASCDDLLVGSPNAAVMVLADGLSESLQRFAPV